MKIKRSDSEKKSQPKIRNSLQLMQKRLLVIILLLVSTNSICPATTQLKFIEANSISFTFHDTPLQEQLQEQKYVYSLNQAFELKPSISIGIQDIQTASSEFTEFFISVSQTNSNSIQFTFKREQKYWKHFRIFFLATTRSQLLLGSIYTNFNSLEGNRAISKAVFSSPIPNYQSSIARSFLNGFSINSMKSIQISIANQKLSQNQLLVQIITGPHFDLKQVWFSFIIFSPAHVTFASMGRSFQQLQFTKNINIEILDIIHKSDYKLMGISLLSILNTNNNQKGINLKTTITQQFVLSLSSEYFIDKLSLNYIVVGNTAKIACEQCFQSYLFNEQCLQKCPAGSYPFKYTRNSGYGCRKCSRQLNLQLNDKGTGCKCTRDSIYKSGICQQVFFQQFTTAVTITSNTSNPSAEQIYQILEKPKINNCSQIKNSYWTGYRCACNIGYIPLATGCESFQSYVRSLSYSSTLYPTQFQYKPQTAIATQNPCKLQELKINGTCQCKQNYYKALDSGICIQCPPRSIFSNSTRNCICQKGFKFDLQTGVCIIDCPSKMILDLQAGKCICQQKYGLYNDECVQCLASDGGYLAFGKCFYCPGNTIFLGTTCGCSQNQVLISSNNTCRNCQKFQTVFNNSCQCYYPNIRNQHGLCQENCSIKQIKIYGQCIGCPKNSYNSGSNICVCDPGYVLFENNCAPFSRSCEDGLYRYKGSCIPCFDSNCAKCNDLGICQTCQSNYQLGADYQCRSICGDGKILDVLEQCDDGNRYSDDGCDKNCKKEPGYQCFGQPTFCISICGNGLVTKYEKCDDGNKNDGDGCSQKCGIEEGFICFGSPSYCRKTSINT